MTRSQNRAENVWIVDDDRSIRWVLEKALQQEGMEPVAFDSADAALARLQRQHPDVLISDIRMPGTSGLDLLATVRERYPQLPVIIMTAHSDLDSAVASYQGGAFEYLPKPFDVDEAVALVRRALAHTHEQEAQNEETLQTRTPEIIGEAPAMQEVFRAIGRLSHSNITVLINGESGTGKELVARALHSQSRRANNPLISVNCAAIPETLIESELFGHEKGAFTGATAQRQGLVEAADGGTLFLDEIGELPLEAQARLLRVLQEGEIRRVGSVQSRKVNVRLVAATHRHLKELASMGEFREDLYYRLNVVELHLPPLRERGEDVVEIATAMLTRACERMQQPAMQFSDEALHAIRTYHWPGNVRELENAVERAVILADDNSIEASLLGIEVSADRYLSETMRNNLVDTSNPYQADDPANGNQGDLSLDDYFVHFVLENEASMTETELAKKLGISRKSLWERRQRLGIPRKKGK